ncbi:unnamed protein product [Blepharisma stoltei]|uniref:Potassium channel domain-containing protein n=1 Tax=Blepharisma stoltei TaxID=1481888 RepID=A0AAU9J5M6_9CILI|nr:unnamed protein product [Blepharisma stoltei]
MQSLKRTHTITQGCVYSKIASSYALMLAFNDPFGDSLGIPTRVATIFPELDISKLKIRFKINSILTGILSVIILVLSIVENESYYYNDFKSTTNINLLRAIIIALNAWLISFVIQYYSIKLHLSKAYRECHINSQLWDIPIRNWMIFEIFICFPATPPYLDWSFEVHELNTYALLSIDDIILGISFIKLYFVFKMIYETSYYSSQKAEIICNLENVRDFMIFSLKTQLKTKPYHSICFLFTIIMISAGFLLRIFERTLEDSDFGFIWNGFSLVGFTELTVGYGDVVPGTHIGRFIIVLINFLGVFIVSSTVLSVEHELIFSRKEMDFYEKKIYNHCVKKKLTPYALGLIIKWWALKKKRRAKEPRWHEFLVFHIQLKRFSLVRKCAQGERNHSLRENIVNFDKKYATNLPKFLKYLQPLKRNLKPMKKIMKQEIQLTEKILKMKWNIYNFQKHTMGNALEVKVRRSSFDLSPSSSRNEIDKESLRHNQTLKVESRNESTKKRFTMMAGSIIHPIIATKSNRKPLDLNGDISKNEYYDTKGT